jgi:hypothetical protein
VIRSLALAATLGGFATLGTLDCLAGNVRLGCASYALAVANYLFLV